MTEGSSLTEFRLDGVMPFPTQLFVEMLTCLEYRKTYDKYTTEIRRMPGVLPDSESEAVYWRLKLPLLAERDYLFVRRILYEPSTQVRTHVCAGRSRRERSALVSLACASTGPHRRASHPPCRTRAPMASRRPTASSRSRRSTARASK